MRLSALRGLATLGVAVGSALMLVMTAGAASDVKIITTADLPLDCQGHPRQIKIQNQGDSAQDLTGWTLQSDKPEEVFDLAVAGTLAAGETMIVANGHNAPQEPYYDSNADTWSYGWNPTTDYDPAAFVLWDDGHDFLQLVDDGGNEVDYEPCPLTLTRPTPTEQGQPTEPPSTNTGSSSNDPTATPTAAPTSGNSVASLTRSRTTSDEPFGPPAPGTEAPLPDSGGPPLAEQSLPLPLMSILAGVSLLLGGGLVVRRALRRPDQG